MTKDAIIHRFLNGYCYALAYELAPSLNLPVEMLFAKRPGQGRIEDPLHVYLRVNQQDIFDIKGRRPYWEMIKDFEGLIGLLHRGPEDRLGFETEVLDDRDDLFDYYNFDPNGLEKVDFQVLSFMEGHMNALLRNAHPPSRDLIEDGITP
jgi:hypothetical protein